MKRALALTLALLGAALAGGAGAPMNQTGHTMPMPFHTASAAHDMQMQMSAMLEPLRPLKGEAFDAAWLDAMILHHGMALGMAQLEVKYGTNPQVREAARAVIKAQQAEIKQMQSWLRPPDGYAAKHVDVVIANMIRGTNPDREFLTEMIPHHQGAVDMAKLALTRTKNAELLKLAQNIIKTQSAEIALYQQWLKALK